MEPRVCARNCVTFNFDAALYLGGSRIVLSGQLVVSLHLETIISVSVVRGVSNYEHVLSYHTLRCFANLNWVDEVVVYFYNFGWYLLVVNWCIAAGVTEPQRGCIKAVIEEVFAVRELKAGNLRSVNLNTFLHSLR